MITKITKAEKTFEKRETTVFAISPGMFSRILNCEERSMAEAPKKEKLAIASGSVLTRPLVCSTKRGTTPATEKETKARMRM